MPQSSSLVQLTCDFPVPFPQVKNKTKTACDVTASFSEEEL